MACGGWCPFEPCKMDGRKGAKGALLGVQPHVDAWVQGRHLVSQTERLPSYGGLASPKTESATSYGVGSSPPFHRRASRALFPGRQLYIAWLLYFDRGIAWLAFEMNSWAAGANGQSLLGVSAVGVSAVGESTVELLHALRPQAEHQIVTNRRRFDFSRAPVLLSRPSRAPVPQCYRSMRRTGQDQHDAGGGQTGGDVSGRPSGPARRCCPQQTIRTGQGPAAKRPQCVLSGQAAAKRPHPTAHGCPVLLTFVGRTLYNAL